MDCHFEFEMGSKYTENIPYLNSYEKMMSENHLPFDRGLPPIAVRADVSPLLIAITQVKGAILQLALGIGFFFF